MPINPNLPMQISSEVRELAGKLILSGKKIEAVRYLQQQFGLTAEEALKLAEVLEPEVNAEREASFRQRPKKSRQKDPMFIYGGLVIFLIGSAMISGAGYIAYSYFRFASNAVSVMGKVVEIDEIRSTDSDGKTSTTQYPIVEYEYEGTTYKSRSTIGSSGSDYSEGEQVEILVNTENPNNVLINTFTERWLIVTFLGAIGLAFFGGGCASIWIGFRF
jgi:hypothetical protein